MGRAALARAPPGFVIAFRPRRPRGRRLLETVGSHRTADDARTLRSPPRRGPPAEARRRRRRRDLDRLVVATLVGILQGADPVRLAPARRALGTWYLFFAVATLVGLSDVGLPATFGRAVSRLWGRESSGGTAVRTGAAAALPRGITVPELYASAFVATALLSLAFAAVALPPALVYFDRVLPTGAGGALVPLLTFFAGVVLNLMGRSRGVPRRVRRRGARRGGA